MWPWFTTHSPVHLCVCVCMTVTLRMLSHPQFPWLASTSPKPSALLLPCRRLNTAHCVSAPSQPQTVPTNVLLIRWLNYSCKDNVDISLKIAVCQILLANLGLQPLLSNSSSDPPSISFPLPPTLWPLLCFSSPFFLSPPHVLHSFMSQAATEAKWLANKHQWRAH